MRLSKDKVQLYFQIQLSFFFVGFFLLISFTTMERESYGEDIANTETEKSDRSDEDDYDDSFINDDGDLAVFSASPISHEGKFKYLC